MSYILDALRKADAQRERDPSRGIHAQAAPVAAPRARAAQPWLWLAAGVLLTALGAYAVRVVGAAPEAAAPVPAVPATAAAEAVPVRVADAVQPPPPVATATPPAPAAVLKAPVAPKPAPAEAAAPEASQPASVKGKAPAAAPRVYAVSELPAELQRALPKLAITGGVHSRNPAQRMLIVGGDVVNEGAELAPGLKLEEIRPRAAVLSFRGYHYSVVY